MASWPRAILPQSSSGFVMPGALQSWGQSGKAQHRATVQAGRIWTETMVPFLATSQNGRELITFINNCWRNGTTFDIRHQSYLTPNGLGTGSPLIQGASQTGTLISTDTWTGSNPVLRTGDIIRIAGLSPVFDITADTANLVAGATILAINPPIFAGASPADNAAITYTNVLINAKIFSVPDIPHAGPNGYIAGLSITFREAL